MISIRALAAWDGLVPEWVERDGATWLSRGPSIYRAPELEARPVAVAEVPAPAWKRLVGMSRLARRLLRMSCYNVVPLGDDRLFVAFDTSLLLYQGGRWSAVNGLARPFRVLRGCCALTPEGDLYLGEYFPNNERKEPVNIYRLAAGVTRAEIVWTFAPGEVRHVHGVHRDPIDDALWVLTGDLPSECRIMRTRERFRTLDTIGFGDESWRAIYPVFTDNAIHYATDSEFAANHIYYLERRALERAVVTEIDGPSYYGAQVAGHAVFATTVEMCPSQKAPLAVIWSVDHNRRAEPLAAYRKDLLAIKPMIPLFQAGIVQFAAGPGGASRHAAPFTGSGLTGLNGRMFMLSDEAGL
jgi:hypothetical protein